MTEFHGPWSAPRPVSDMIASLDKAALGRLIRSLTPAERDNLWQKLVEEGDRIAPADPRQALLWHLRKEQWRRYDQWFAKLDLVQKSAAYLALLGACDGTADPEVLMKQF